MGRHSFLLLRHGLLLRARDEGTVRRGQYDYSWVDADSRSYREIDIMFKRRIPARKFKETVISPEDDE